MENESHQQAWHGGLRQAMQVKLQEAEGSLSSSLKRGISDF
jgi:hypothetical protein